MSEKTIQERLRERLTDGREGLLNVLCAMMSTDEANAFIDVALDSLNAVPSEDVVEQVARAICSCALCRPKRRRHRRDERERYAKLASERASSAYMQFVTLAAKHECAGEEFRLSSGRFTLQELNAHRDASEQLGRHRAFAEIAEVIRARNEEK